jgi:DNA-binding MarR family transcriptional regulator
VFNLQSYLPYLLNRVGFAVTDVFSEALAADDLTVPMWRVLAVLWHHGPQRIGDLADLTSIEISTLSRLLSTLQRRRLLGRKRARNDARVVMVALTERGVALTQSLIPAATELESILVDVLKKTLDKLYANVRQPSEAQAAQSA